jgi:glycogenin
LALWQDAGIEAADAIRCSERMAYVTVLSTDSYLDGVLALNESLRLARAGYTLYAAVGANVSRGVRRALARAGIRQIALPALDIPEEILQANVRSDYHRHWAGVFEKLHVFSLTGFDKIVYLDSDMMILQNIDHLFEAPHMSAVIAGGANYRDFNAGLMVIEPEPGLTDELVALLPEAFESEKRWRLAAGRPPSLGDQSVLNQHWHDWIEQTGLRLDGKYNVVTDHLDYYMRELGYRWRGPEGIHVLHFIGETKPWMRSGKETLRTVTSLAVERKFAELAALGAYAGVLGLARLRLACASACACRSQP